MVLAASGFMSAPCVVPCFPTSTVRHDWVPSPSSTASPNHVEVRSPGAVARHRDYVSALGARGVSVELGHFRRASDGVRTATRRSSPTEEKETDVAIAVRMMSMLRQSECDAMVLITADGDLAPAIREASRCFSAVPIYCGFPFGRGSHDLRAVATRVIRLRRDRYSAHQLPDLIVLPDGGVVRRPPAW